MTSVRRWFAWVVALISDECAVAVVLAVAGPQGESRRRPCKAPGSVDPRQDMITALPASRPHPSLGDEAHAFDRLVVAWGLRGFLSRRRRDSHLAPPASSDSAGSSTATHCRTSGSPTQRGTPRSTSSAHRCAFLTQRPSHGESYLCCLLSASSRLSRGHGGGDPRSSSRATPGDGAQGVAGRSTTSGPTPSSGAASGRATAGRRGDWSRSTR